MNDKTRNSAARYVLQEDPRRQWQRSPEIRGILIDAVNEVLPDTVLTPGAAPGADTPNILYHYTNPTAFLAMLETGELWASDSCHLNDLKEEVVILDVLRETDPTAADRCKEWMFSRRVFIGSLSAEGDLLGQWRAYCRPNGGMAIGFHTSGLLTDLTGHTLLAKCHYSNESLGKVPAIVKRARELLNKGAADGDLCTDESLDSAVQAFLTPMFKHNSFADEREWRVIHYGDATGYHPTGDGLVPHVAIKFSHGNIVQVFVGPSPRGLENRAAVEDYVQSRDIWCEVYNSAAPYRSW